MFVTWQLENWARFPGLAQNPFLSVEASLWEFARWFATCLWLQEVDKKERLQEAVVRMVTFALMSQEPQLPLDTWLNPTEVTQLSCWKYYYTLPQIFCLLHYQNCNKTCLRISTLHTQRFQHISITTALITHSVVYFLVFYVLITHRVVYFLVF